MDVYKKGVGVIKKFQPVNTFSEAEQALEKYCRDNNVQVWSFLCHLRRVAY